MKSSHINNTSAPILQNYSEFQIWSLCVFVCVCSWCCPKCCVFDAVHNVLDIGGWIGLGSLCRYLYYYYLWNMYFVTCCTGLCLNLMLVLLPWKLVHYYVVGYGTLVHCNLLILFSMFSILLMADRIRVDRGRWW